MFAIGLMSGTSMDGVDASLIYTNGTDQVKIVANHSIAYSNTFRTLLKAAEFSCKKNNGDLKQSNNNFKEDLILFLSNELLFDDNKSSNFLEQNFLSISDIIHQSTLYHLQVINELLALKPDILKQDIFVIGYHGQTLFHAPKQKLTVAIGNPQFLTDKLQITVIFNFRKSDLLNGGRGAPLVPIYHQAMVTNLSNFPVALINCGGITNVTIIQNDRSLLAYDIGPGSCLLDRLIVKRTQNKITMDVDGRLAALGSENLDLIDKLFKNSMINNHQNFYSPTPKALDVNDFCLIPELDDISLEDACRNLIIFTAETIIANFKAQKIIPKLIIFAGGGWNNPILVAELKNRFYQKIDPNISFLFANEIGYNNQYVESQAFGYMAVRRLKDLPISFPETTGVNTPTIGGEVFLPSN